MEQNHETAIFLWVVKLNSTLLFFSFFLQKTTRISHMKTWIFFLSTSSDTIPLSCWSPQVNIYDPVVALTHTPNRLFIVSLEKVNQFTNFNMCLIDFSSLSHSLTLLNWAEPLGLNNFKILHFLNLKHEENYRKNVLVLKLTSPHKLMIKNTFIKIW